MDFALKLSSYSSLKLLICLKWIRKMFPHYHILTSSNINCQSLPLSLTYLYNLKHITTVLNYIGWKDIRIKQLHFTCLNTSKVQETVHTYTTFDPIFLKLHFAVTIHIGELVCKISASYDNAKLCLNTV